ncbi:hypothetical protein F4779DRAFT_616864 [Xylariaceae sp. FL0662B]|nr:hypothetical protein F4779DRAFT_616864 [Xylariaceae sp. FL0662B]
MLSTPTYQSIQNWICQQQEYEATHSSPAPLTDAQRKALRALQLALPQTPMPPVEVNVGDTNWFRASRPRLNGDNKVDFRESSVDGLTLSWLCEVLIGEHPTPFPGPSGGLLPDGKQPSFPRKKDAKQYAAKCAIEWLRNNGHMPQDGVKFSKAQRATPLPLALNNNDGRSNKKQKMCPPSPDQPKTPTSKPGRQQPVTSPNAPVPGSSPSPFNEDERSAAHQVAKLCHELGFAPFRYVLNKDPDSPGFYSGYPDFGMHAPRFPEGLGRVENVYNQKAAKEKIAEAILTHLRQVQADREKEIQDVLQGLPPVSKDG